MRLQSEQATQLEDYAYQIRRLSLEMITCGQWGHPGGSLSMAEIMSVLYFHAMRIDPANPQLADRDRFILSKAHSSPALYATLALKGFFPVSDLYRYCQIGGIEGHTDMRRTKGVESSGGSLGMGLSIATGLLGLRKKESQNPRVLPVGTANQLPEISGTPCQPATITSTTSSRFWITTRSCQRICMG